jgi:hypothetical protein
MPAYAKRPTDTTLYVIRRGKKDAGFLLRTFCRVQPRGGGEKMSMLVGNEKVVTRRDFDWHD